MRRRPEEDDQEHQNGFEPDRAGGGGPSDHRRKRAGSAADDDVLRRPTLQPHRVDRHVEENREGKERSGQPIGDEPQHRDRADRQRHAEGQRLPGQYPPRRNRPLCGARHHGIDIGIEPHVERARSACPDRDAQQGRKSQHRMELAGRHHQPDERGENHEVHHPRLHEHYIVADRSFADGKNRGRGCRSGGRDV